MHDDIDKLFHDQLGNHDAGGFQPEFWQQMESQLDAVMPVAASASQVGQGSSLTAWGKAAGFVKSLSPVGKLVVALGLSGAITAGGYVLLSEFEADPQGQVAALSTESSQETTVLPADTLAGDLPTAVNGRSADAAEAIGPRNEATATTELGTRGRNTSQDLISARASDAKPADGAAGTARQDARMTRAGREAATPNQATQTAAGGGVVAPASSASIPSGTATQARDLASRQPATTTGNYPVSPDQSSTETTSVSVASTALTPPGNASTANQTPAAAGGTRKGSAPSLTTPVGDVPTQLAGEPSPPLVAPLPLRSAPAPQYASALAATGSHAPSAPLALPGKRWFQNFELSLVGGGSYARGYQHEGNLYQFQDRPQAAPGPDWQWRFMPIGGLHVHYYLNNRWSLGVDAQYIRRQGYNLGYHNQHRQVFLWAREIAQEVEITTLEYLQFPLHVNWRAADRHYVGLGGYVGTLINSVGQRRDHIRELGQSHTTEHGKERGYTAGLNHLDYGLSFRYEYELSLPLRVGFMANWGLADQLNNHAHFGLGDGTPQALQTRDFQLYLRYRLW